MTTLQSEVASTEKQIEDLHDSAFVITVSTTENKVYARRNGELVFEAVCSTGSNSTLETSSGQTMVFRTPIGRFRIKSKEENPKWVPPDWHYVEQARKNGLERRAPGARPEHRRPVRERQRRLRQRHPATPEGTLIVRGGAVVIPPVGTRSAPVPRRPRHAPPQPRRRLRAARHAGGLATRPQRLARLRAPAQRRHRRLYEMANVGDEVIIY
jgi:hypothetical protein